MFSHFEQLWEECEKLAPAAETNSTDRLIEALTLKLKLYRAVDVQEMSPEDTQHAKTRVLGEILMTLTRLSAQDNINVFQALQLALQYHTVEKLHRQY